MTNFLQNENMFIETVRMFLPVFLEFLAYYILCRKSKKSKSFFSCILYFSVMLVLHTVIWLHARSLDFPKFPPYITADGVRFDYYIYAITSIWTSATYLIMYLLRTWKHRSKQVVIPTISKVQHHKQKIYKGPGLFGFQGLHKSKLSCSTDRFRIAENVLFLHGQLAALHRVGAVLPPEPVL